MLLMPPSLGSGCLRIIWCGRCLGAVDQMDLDRFTEAYRLGAAGRAPYDPAMMVALLALRVCAREPVLAGDRAGVLGGRGLQGDHRDAHAGSFDDRGVPPPARGARSLSCLMTCWGCVARRGWCRSG